MMTPRIGAAHARVAELHRAVIDGASTFATQAAQLARLKEETARRQQADALAVELQGKLSASEAERASLLAQRDVSKRRIHELERKQIMHADAVEEIAAVKAQALGLRTQIRDVERDKAQLEQELDSMRSRLVVLEVQRKRAHLQALVDARSAAGSGSPTPQPPQTPSLPRAAPSGPSTFFLTATTNEATAPVAQAAGLLGLATYEPPPLNAALAASALAAAHQRELALSARVRDCESQLRALHSMIDKSALGCALCAARPALEQLVLEVFSELEHRLDLGLKAISALPAATRRQREPGDAAGGGARTARAHRHELVEALVTHRRLRSLLGETRVIRDGPSAGAAGASELPPPPPPLPNPPTLAEQALRPPTDLHRPRHSSAGISRGSMSARNARAARVDSSGSRTARAPPGGVRDGKFASLGPPPNIHAWAERAAWRIHPPPGPAPSIR
jgi:hypothetical protein